MHDHAERDAEVRRLRTVLAETTEALERACAELKMHQDDYHHRSAGISAWLQARLAAAKAAVTSTD